MGKKGKYTTTHDVTDQMLQDKLAALSQQWQIQSSKRHRTSNESECSKHNYQPDLVYSQYGKNRAVSYSIDAGRHFEEYKVRPTEVSIKLSQLDMYK